MSQVTVNGSSYGEGYVLNTPIGNIKLVKRLIPLEPIRAINR